MCFSLQASFIASAFLAVMAVASYRKMTKQVDQKQFSGKLGLILIMTAFAIQQFFEGLVWAGLQYHYSATFMQVAVYGFIFFAFIFWPTYVPISMYRLEQNQLNKKILGGYILIGLSVSLILLERILYYGVTAELASCHIMYTSSVSQLGSHITVLIMLAYLLVTVGSILLSTYPKMRLMGLLIGGAYVISYLFYLNFLVSVWCFFAAISSLLLYWIIKK